MTLAFFTAHVVHSLKAWVADFSSDDLDEDLELFPLLLRETFDAIDGRIWSLQNAGTFLLLRLIWANECIPYKP